MQNKCKINVNSLTFRTWQVLSQRQSETEKTSYIRKHSVREEVSQCEMNTKEETITSKLASTTMYELLALKVTSYYPHHAKLQTSSTKKDIKSRVMYWSQDRTKGD